MNADESAKHIIPAIPVQESEAWMLCDKELLKDLLETDLSYREGTRANVSGRSY